MSHLQCQGHSGENFGSASRARSRTTIGTGKTIAADPQPGSRTPIGSALRPRSAPPAKSRVARLGGSFGTSPPRTGSARDRRLPRSRLHPQPRTPPTRSTIRRPDLGAPGRRAQHRRLSRPTNPPATNRRRRPVQHRHRHRRQRTATAPNRRARVPSAAPPGTATHAHTQRTSNLPQQVASVSRGTDAYRHRCTDRSVPHPSPAGWGHPPDRPPHARPAREVAVLLSVLEF